MLSESKYFPFHPVSRSIVFNSFVSMKGIVLSPHFRPTPTLTAPPREKLCQQRGWFAVDFPIIILDYPISRGIGSFFDGISSSKIRRHIGRLDRTNQGGRPTRGALVHHGEFNTFRHFPRDP